MERAGFIIRLGAFLLDGIVFGIASWVVSFVTRLIFNMPEPIDPVTGAVTTGIWLGYVISFGLAFLYYVWIPKRTNGQTLGKKLTGIRIAKVNEDPLTIWTLFLREFIGKFISSVILFIGYLMALGKQKRALHDYIAGTIVVKAN